MQISEIDPRTAHAAIEAFQILDVREAFEVEGPLGKLAGAANLPLHAVAQQAGSLDASARWLLVCRSGKRSESACQILREHGIPDVTNLAGGMIAWNLAALPIVRRRSGNLQSLLESSTRWLAQVSGATPTQAGERMAVWLREVGGSATALSAQALEHLLARVEQTLREANPPPDLELTLAAFRRDLAAL